MAETVFQNSGCVNTVLGAYNMLNAFIPLEYYANIDTTLNAKYAVLAQQEPTSPPKLQYFGVGIQGYYNNGEEHAKYNPDSRNMDLYTPIPIRMVEIKEDGSELTPEERANYRMRKVVTINGTSYACYYLKKIVWDPSYVQLVQVGTDGSESTYALDPGEFLSPTPIKGTTGGQMTTGDAHVIVRAVGKCEVSLKELVEAMSVLYGKDYCILSEAGFYTGCECYVNAEEELLQDVQEGKPENAVNIEAVYVQLAKHKCFLPKTLDGTESSATFWVSYESPTAIEI